MKRIVCLIIAAFAIRACAQVEPAQYDWKVTLNIIDETGQPVAGVKAGVGNGISKFEMSGVTDTNGIFVASHRDATENLAFYAEKSGYYPFQMTYHKGRNYKPEIWNPVQTIVLKRIIKPIPMYAKQARTHVPDLDKPVGYDLTVGDWIAPYGRGIQGDILFTAHFGKPNNDESDFTLTVSFPNQKDGIQEFTAPTYYLGSQGSELRSAEEAPADGYQPEWIQTDNRKAGQLVKTNRDLNRNYYFRVRTKVDDRGNIVSAHYGKIYGDFMQFSYYLNPTPNSRNVEFDPKQNLMKNLKPGEGVSEP
jgi:hypothetical protein